MKKEVNHAIRKRFNEVIYHVARYMEILLSVVILGVIALVGIRLVCDVTSREILKADGSRASENLGDADRSDRHWDFICDPQVSDDRSRRHGVP